MSQIDWEARQRGIWVIDVRVEIAPKYADVEPEVFSEVAAVHYREGDQINWTSRQVAADFLRTMADEIEHGELPEGAL